VKGLKVLLVGGGLALVAGVMATAGLVYVAYRVKGKVERAAREVTAEAGASHPSWSRAEAPVRRIDPCTLLTREEASENSPGISTTEDLAGIGDRALMGPVDVFLAFVKGRTGVQIDLSQVPQGRDKGVAMARRIASRL